MYSPTTASKSLLPMSDAMKGLLRGLVSPGEFAALKNVWVELKISHYHRQGLRLLRKKNLGRPKNINLGSGPVVKAGYLNVDLFPGGDITLDLRRGLPFELNCCERIVSEHFFEHLAYPGTVVGLMRECLRVLQPGGELRISVPDTEWVLAAYAEGEGAPYYQTAREQGWHPGCESRMERLNFHFRQGSEHLFAYDYETLAKAFKTAGFVDIRPEPVDPAIDSEHRRVGSLIVSGRKPA